MDDLSEKLAEILNDPESLNRVRAMAEGLLGGENAKENSAQQQSAVPNTGMGLGDSGLDPAQITKIMSVMSRLKNSSNDSRANLLLALKPLLSAPRREKVDTAIKLLKLIDMLPLLRDSGIFEF